MEWQYLTYRTAARAASNKEWISSTSVDYLMFSGYVTLASHWLKMESAAVNALASGAVDEESAFYTAKIQTSEFVFERLLPRTRAERGQPMCGSLADAAVNRVETALAGWVETRGCGLDLRFPRRVVSGLCLCVL